MSLDFQQGMPVTDIAQDEGIGIPKADQNQLFSSFHRATNVGTISGTGLGLPIVKKSVELHAGKIVVESEVRAGTTFIVRVSASQTLLTARL
jgi:signal transduction histidine kinase